MRLLITKKYKSNYDLAVLMGILSYMAWGATGLWTSEPRDPSIILRLWFYATVCIILCAVFAAIVKAITNIFDIKIEKD